MTVATQLNRGGRQLRVAATRWPSIEQQHASWGSIVPLSATSAKRLPPLPCTPHNTKHNIDGQMGWQVGVYEDLANLAQNNFRKAGASVSKKALVQMVYRCAQTHRCTPAHVPAPRLMPPSGPADQIRETNWMCDIVRWATGTAFRVLADRGPFIANLVVLAAREVVIDGCPAQILRWVFRRHQRQPASQAADDAHTHTHTHPHTHVKSMFVVISIRPTFAAHTHDTSFSWGSRANCDDCLEPTQTSLH